MESKRVGIRDRIGMPERRAFDPLLRIFSATNGLLRLQPSKNQKKRSNLIHLTDLVDHQIQVGAEIDRQKGNKWIWERRTEK